MKLYVWNNPTRIDYGASCLYVMAPNLTAARKAALSAADAAFGETWKVERMRLADLGKPTRVLSGPYAEVYWWSE